MRWLTYPQQRDALSLLQVSEDKSEVGQPLGRLARLLVEPENKDNQTSVSACGGAADGI